MILVVDDPGVLLRRMLDSWIKDLWAELGIRFDNPEVCDIWFQPELTTVQVQDGPLTIPRAMVWWITTKGSYSI